QCDLPLQATLAEEKALDLEYRHLPEVVDLTRWRGEYGAVLDHFQSLVDDYYPHQLPRDFLARVVRLADRWRALDADNAGVCRKAAEILEALGAHELAGDYRSTAGLLELRN